MILMPFIGYPLFYYRPSSPGPSLGELILNTKVERLSEFELRANMGEKRAL
jgi:hypothetical protein